MTDNRTVQEVFDTFDVGQKTLLYKAAEQMADVRESHIYRSLNPDQQTAFDFIVGQAGK